MGVERNQRIILGSTVGLFQRVVQVVATLIALPLVLRSLGVANFGIWGAATSLAWLTSILDLGLGSALITIIPRVIVSGKTDTRLHVAAALFCGAFLSALVLSVGIPLVFVGTGGVETGPFLIACIGLALNIPLSVSSSIWFGIQKGYAASGWEIVQTILAVALLGVGAALHAGVVAMVCAIYGALVITNCASLAHIFFRHPDLRPTCTLPSGSAMRIVLEQGGMLFLMSVAVSATYVFDNVLTLRWLGETASAQMTIALRLCTTASGILAVITQPLWPAFVEAETLGDRRWSWRTLITGSAAIASLACIGAVFIGLLGKVGLKWWLGSDLGISSALLWATGLWIIVMCSPRIAGLLFNAALMLKYQVAAAAVALVVAYILKISLAGSYGVIGILSATPFSWLAVVWPAFILLAVRWRQRPTEQAGLDESRSLDARR
jgi:O-antigen/teichoic acid export membrane protein